MADAFDPQPQNIMDMTRRLRGYDADGNPQYNWEPTPNGPMAGTMAGHHYADRGYQAYQPAPQSWGDWLSDAAPHPLSWLDSAVKAAKSLDWGAPQKMPSVYPHGALDDLGGGIAHAAYSGATFIPQAINGHVPLWEIGPDGQIRSSQEAIDRAMDATLLAAGGGGLAIKGGERAAALANASDDAAGAVEAARQLDPLGYYSQALESAKGLKQAKGSGDQILGALRNSGVKQNEIDATGLGDWLKGQKSVTRDDVVDWLGKNRIKPREVRYGQGELNQDAVSKLRGIFPDMGDDEMARTAQRNDPKWSSYSLDPSNPSYRESVMHLPPNMDMNAGRQAFEKQYPGKSWDSLKPDDQEYFARKVLIDTPRDDFQSGHWSEPNVVSHTRSSMVQDAQGRPVYHIDELQSDWGQKIRDQGGPVDPAKYNAAKDAVDAARAKSEAAATEALRLNPIKNLNSGSDLGLADHGQSRLADDLVYSLRARANNPSVFDRITNPDYAGAADRLEAALAEHRLRGAELRQMANPAPGHPLVNTTDQWVNTALRRAVTQAVEGNADAMAIPSGRTVGNYGMGGEQSGLDYAYDKMYPSKLKAILQKLDPSISPSYVDQLFNAAGQAPERSAGHTLFPLTDVAKEAVRKNGLPLFSNADPHLASVLAMLRDRQ